MAFDGIVIANLVKELNENILNGRISKIADKITPHTGFINPNTATLEMGLYFNKIPHKEYATAEISARYISIVTEVT